MCKPNSCYLHSATLAHITCLNDKGDLVFYRQLLILRCNVCASQPLSLPAQIQQAAHSLCSCSAFLRGMLSAAAWMCQDKVFQAQWPRKLKTGSLLQKHHQVWHQSTSQHTSTDLPQVSFLQNTEQVVPVCVMKFVSTKPFFLKYISPCSGLVMCNPHILLNYKSYTIISCNVVTIH